ncbi:Spo0B C-terminal domain-containing protein [Bacillus sp. FJAT-45037]|uniref:Spo0B C-terminal domain-containing protein n=1 Tax=Bacillus sp. FJAT-45037 TaxID=2011007 RepID=UPI000C233FC0|nr:Spo0B C-terminal domain-containing protein [Bacillus sp. FJAT-45037]
MTKQWEILDALRHTRHDWLNVMQLIKGNLALKRYDKIEQIIEDVTNQSINESKLTMLNVPKVATYLLTYNWLCTSMKVDVDVIGETMPLSVHEDNLIKLSQEIIEKLADSSSSSSENHLLVTFLFANHSKEDQCQITFDYQGTLQMKKEEWTSILSELVPIVSVMEWNEHECVLQSTFTLN